MVSDFRYCPCKLLCYNSSNPFRGPIVRITPDELHIKDPYFYDEIYASGGRRRDKTPGFVNAASFPGAMFATVNHEQHRFRRGILSKLFSKQSVKNFEAIIQEKVNLLARILEKAIQSGAVVELHKLFGGLGADVITQYAYGTSHGYLEGNQRGGDVVEAIYQATSLYHTALAFPLLASVAQKLPFTILRKMPVNVVPILEFREWAGTKFAEAVQEGKEESEDHRTIFEILVDDKIPEAEKDPLRMKNEAAAIIGAGTDTTARAMAVALFHLLENRDQLQRLREELHPVMSNKVQPAKWAELEQLPYLVSSSLRVKHFGT